MPKKAKEAKTKKRKASFLGKLFRTFLVLAIWGAIALSLLVVWFSHDLPDLKKLHSNVRKPSVLIQSFDGTTLGTYGDLYEDVVRVQDLPPYVPQALMAVEDRRFYFHFGVDFIGLIRAAYENYRAKRVVQGGSTLTQQLAKNILFTEGHFSVDDRSYKRKVQEVLLALWLEWKFTKDQILTMYLNRVYFGAGTYGIDAAARKYFNKSARSLSVFEAAVIAGLLKAPSKYSPAHHPERAIKRAKIVLSLMQEAGFVRDYNAYLEQGQKEIKETAQQTGQGARYFTDWVYEMIPTMIGSIDRDIIVVTTLNVDMQQHAEKVCKEHLETTGKEFKTSELAFIALSPEGAVKAMVGGKDYTASQFNRVTQAMRQPGSAFKMFIYLAAMEAGRNPQMMIDDSPFVLGKWRPGNYMWKSQGEVSLRTAFARSINSVSIRLTQELGPSAVASVAQRLGISSQLNTDLTISLGTGETTLLEMASAYATFANAGHAVWPYGVLEIRDKNSGQILYRHQASPTKTIVGEPALENMRQLLRAVIEEGSGKAADVDSTVAGKTGSNGDKDAWFFGYRETPLAEGDEGFSQVVVGVWTGNDNGALMSKKSTGGRIPARVAGSFFRGNSKGDHKKKPSHLAVASGDSLDNFLRKKIK
jgi:penicillin-binding protein 1A